MKKIVILFLSIIVLTPMTLLADDQSTLPPLPPAFEQESTNKSVEQNVESADQESLWQKIKSFFGFGEEKEKTGTKSQTIKDTSQDLKQPEKAKIVEKEKEVIVKTEEKVEAPKSETQLPQPMSIIDNGQQINKVNQEPSNLDSTNVTTTPIVSKDSSANQVNINTPQQVVNTSQQNESDQLQLPAGFGDENQATSTNITSVSKVPETTPSLITTELKTINTPNTEPLQPSQLELPKVSEENNKENTEPKEDKKDLTTPASSFVSEKVADVKNDPNDITPPALDPSPSLPQKIETAPVPEDNKVELPKPEAPVEKVDNIAEKTDITSSPTPAYVVEESEKNAKGDNASAGSDSLVSKYTKQVQNSKSIKELPKITSDEIEKSDKLNSASDEKVDDSKQLKFIEDEAKVLSIPNDDVVLGELTDEAKLEQVDFREYVIKFWEFYNNLAREPRRKEIDNFIQKFDDNADYSH
ncbi:MAG: hypothetical protein J0L79_01550 [Rickettsiales bacterium]|nr:hypothetical protein [Rickettsiales bacterium]